MNPTAKRHDISPPTASAASPVVFWALLVIDRPFILVVSDDGRPIAPHGVRYRRTPLPETARKKKKKVLWESGGEGRGGRPAVQ